LKEINLGIDIGSVSVNVAVLAPDGDMVDERYIRHRGRPFTVALEALREVISRYGEGAVRHVAMTGSGGRKVAEALSVPYVNEIVAQAKAAEAIQPEARTIIEIGGEDSKLINLKSEDGGLAVEDFAMNTICAAGTGSFLDQQASRLNLSIEDEFGKLALKSKNPPRIAGRCSVFAKTDMIHLQQQATPDYDIVAGLCYAMARNFKSNLGRGMDFVKPVAFHGGVAANIGVVKALKDVFDLKDGELIVPHHHASMGAIGAALEAAEKGFSTGGLSMEGLERAGRELASMKEIDYRLEPLSSGVEEVKERLSTGRAVAGMDVYLGIDVGSISTNVVAIDAEGGLLAKSYLMTSGRPLDAVKKGLAEVHERLGVQVNVRGVGSTGSGRYLTGDFVGADVVRNEITAQARAAIAIDPDVDTVFEIGGQDSKYISLAGGVVIDFEMNHACAAGTGSYLEEQAEKLGIDIKAEFGDLALKSRFPVRLGERCTVFMESDVVHYQQAGASIDELVGGLSYSIVRNYLNRVVGKRMVGERILFQGGVAANRGVVAAFNKVVGKTVVVPPHHEVTGAIGVALLAREHAGSSAGDFRSGFRGFQLASRKYALKSFTCSHCPNMCEVKEVVIEGEQPLYYGSRCDRYNIKKVKRDNTIPDLFLEREAILEGYLKAPYNYNGIDIGIPRALFFHEYMPFWATFFSSLGFRVVLSRRTNKTVIKRGVESVLSETCFPVKAAHGHVIDLVEKGIKHIFIPSIITSTRDDQRQERNFFCPYVQTIPYLVSVALRVELSGSTLIRPVIYLDRDREEMVSALLGCLEPYGVSGKDVAGAVDMAWDSQNEFNRRLKERGREVLAGLQSGERACVIVSRAYNGCDPEINLDLPGKLRDLGVMAIPMDFLEIDARGDEDHWDNMFWKYGQRILKAAGIINRDERINAVYLSNFGCGPDSFLTTFFRKAMGGKPFLQLEIDEHSADAGIRTRCEAFLDSMKNVDGRKAWPFSPASFFVKKSVDGRILFIPHMCEHAHGLAAAFRTSGIDARVMPPSDEESLELGRRYTVGKECFPAIITTGDMLRQISSPDFDPSASAFFMPSGTGPCRFGQYNTLHKIILTDLGFGDVPVMSLNQGRKFYEDFKDLKSDPSRNAWHAILSSDLITKALHAIRPYETEKGLADRVHEEAIARICYGIMNGRTFAAVRECANMFREIPTDGRGSRPLVAVVGEIFVRQHVFSNNDLIRQLEGQGAEVVLSSFAEWIYYINFTGMRQNREFGDYRHYFQTRVKDTVELVDEMRMSRYFRGLFSPLRETRPRKYLDLSNRYIHDSFEGETTVTLGKSIESYHEGTSGIVNVMPFTCMPGTIVSGMLKQFRADHDSIPVISIAYEGQKEMGAVTRLEAFMHQVREYHRSREGAGRRP